MEKMSYKDLEHACAVFCRHFLYLWEVSNSTVRVLNTYFLLVSQLPLVLVVQVKH